ncbi:acyl-CoA thioesterase [Flavimarina sp. Hel_I_48]|uniref:acyl-CoA thioesterase n=1 Tax=Flavimarina sp. Hel_I_48 TaxID=1392488 RepID=UPI0004DF7C18|nr:thioesterase family protein [Flavimarina sp. Hel_I_48]
MFTYRSTLRVRYAETDQMGVVHHGNYASYLELARIEWLENLGFSYKKLEADGVMLPVYDLKFSFKSPAYFDDTLTVETTLATLPSASIIFDYNIYNEDQKLITTAQSTLVFVDMKTRRPIRCPENILDRLKQEGS